MAAPFVTAKGRAVVGDFPVEGSSRRRARLRRQYLPVGEFPPVAEGGAVVPILTNRQTGAKNRPLQAPPSRATLPKIQHRQGGSGMNQLRKWLPAFVASVALGCGPMAPTVTPNTTSVPELAEQYVAMDCEPDDLPFELESDFRPLTAGDFQQFPMDTMTWSFTEDVLSCTGKPKGYLYSTDNFANFTWRFEYRYPRPEKLTADDKFKGNTGFLVYITGEPKIWPVCLEVQGKHSDMAAVKENGGAQAPEVESDPDKRLTARKRVGQWNAVEIVSNDGELTISLNGQTVTKSRPAFLSAGSIGIQAEDHPFEVRRIRIRVDP
jgi:hypothetical protein